MHRAWIFLGVLLAASARAQVPINLSTTPVSTSSSSVSASTAPLQSAATSSALAPEVAGSSEAVQSGVAPRKAAPPRPPEIVIERDAAAWTPFSVRRSTQLAGGDFFTRKVPGEPGERSRAPAIARAHRAKGKDVLVIAVFPESLRARRTHLELRYVIDRKFLDGVTLAAVTALSGPAGLDEDSFGMSEMGIEFEEVSPSKARIAVGSLELRRRAPRNVGEVKSAYFGDSLLGTIGFRYAVTGLGKKTSTPTRRRRRS